MLSKNRTQSYAKITSKQSTDLDQLQETVEARTNAMLKVTIDYISQHSEKVVESVATLSNTIMNCISKFSDVSPERRKRSNQGAGSQVK